MFGKVSWEDDDDDCYGGVGYVDDVVEDIGDVGVGGDVVVVVDDVIELVVYDCICFFYYWCGEVEFFDEVEYGGFVGEVVVVVIVGFVVEGEYCEVEECVVDKCDLWVVFY